MTSHKRILIPTDFTPSAKRAYEFSCLIASNKNMLIDLIHIVPTSSYFDEIFREDNNLPDLHEDLYPELSKEAELQLKKEMNQYIPEQYRGNCYLESDSDPSRVIVEFATEGDYLMIVMISKDVGDDGLFKSSTTEQVLRKSKVSVMILDEKTSIENMKSILVPTDGSMNSLTAFPAALNFANLFDGRITMLYVDEVYGLLSNHFSTKPSKSIKSEIIQFLLNRLREYFKTIESNKYELITGDNFTNPVIKTGKDEHHTVPLRVKIVTGSSAHHEITKYANRYSDFVVMATHGRSGLAQFFIGSNAEKVALNIEKSILTIRPEPDLFTKKVESEV